MDDMISRQAVLKLLHALPPEEAMTKAMLIQSVKQMDAAQPEKRTDKRTETHACDLIDRQAALDAIESAFDRETILNRFVRKIAISAVRLLPSAQPEIVACGDCIHWICHDRRCGYWNHGVKPLDWCCHAERSTDG